MYHHAQVGRKYFEKSEQTNKKMKGRRNKKQIKAVKKKSSKIRINSPRKK
jgi:hypothetical protein